MKPIRLSWLIAGLIAALSICPSARAQNVPEGTTLGRSQNSTEDLVNSLVPGPRRFDKGEKKEEVDPKKLPSKKLNDKTFSGNLMDIGVDWTGDKMGKPHGTEPKTSKSAEADGKKDPKVAAKQTGAGGDKEKASKPADPAVDAKKEKASNANTAATDKANGGH